MIPTLAFQTAVRNRLVNDPEILDRVDSTSIRSGSIRPEQMPAIMLSPTHAEIHGRASGGQIVAELRQMVHVYARTDEDGGDNAQQIAADAFLALLDAPEAEGFAIDEWDRPHLVWTDQAAAFGDTAHGAISLRAVIRWHE